VDQGTCDSCGLGADDLAPVHRVYLAPDESGELGPAETVLEVEHWCGSCRAHYPHVPAEGERRVTP
jgi:hypothetical protein